MSDTRKTGREGVATATLGRSALDQAYLGNLDSHLAAIDIRVPGGVFTTAHGYHRFINEGDLEWRIGALLDGLDIEDLTALRQAGATIRGWIMETALPGPLENAIRTACSQMRSENDNQIRVTVSAWGSDFTGSTEMQASLHVLGTEAVFKAIKTIYARFFDDEAIAERGRVRIGCPEQAQLVCVHPIVRADIGASGTLITGNNTADNGDLVVIDACYGLDPRPIQCTLHPDRFMIHKSALLAGNLAVAHRTMGTKSVKTIFGDIDHGPTRIVPVPEPDRKRFCMTEAQLEELCQQGLRIERHFGRPMHIKWALDGLNGHLYVIQASIDANHG